MKKKKIGWLMGILFVLTALFLAACGGGGGSTTDTTTTDTTTDTGGGTGNTGGGTSGVTPPAIQGFDFALKEGDYWEYRWDYYSSSWAMGSSSSSTLQTGRFRAALGAPVTISGTQAFPVVISGVAGYTPSSGSPVIYSPRWKYLAIKDNAFLGSTDGAVFSVIFDAQNGFWPGGGFFIDLGATALNQAQTGAVAGTRNITQYISGSAIKTGLAGSQSTCQYYPGFGTICGDSSYSFDRWEYFLPNLGPVGYYYYNTYSDCGGGFCSGATWEQMVGLVSSSLQGDTVDYVLENEPNDSPAGAQPLTNQVAVMGMAAPFAPGWDVTGKSILVGPDTYGWSVIEDLYKFTLPLSAAMKTVTITLDFSGAAGTDTDYDLYLINGTGTTVIASSTSDNVSTGIYQEQIIHSLGAGPYLVGIEAFSNGSKAEYKLNVSW